MRFLKLIQAAVQRRSKLASGFTSFRIFDSVGDGIEGLAIDRYDRVLICQVLSQFRQELEVELSLDLETLAKLTNTETIYLRIRNPSAEKLSSQVIECIFGSPKASFTISESDLAFLIKPEEHLNAGLFLDTRNIRSRLRNISLGKRVLNTFCFSGTLGVAAAVGGASEVVQLDSSKSALNWARENYHLNAENIKANIRYIPDHVPRFLEKEIRRIQNGRPSFDIVVLDPPAFGRAGKDTFQFERDAFSLVESSLELLSKQGRLFFSTNSGETSNFDLIDIVRSAASNLNRSLKDIQKVKLPLDFTAPESKSGAMRGIEAEFC